jgi:TatD DNase family protein
MSYEKSRQIIDTHCHPQFPQYDSDRQEVIQRALDTGIGMVVVGTDFETSQQAVELAAKYEGIWCSVGLHPNDNLDERYNQSSYEKLAGAPKVVAVGEIGLDYYRTPDREKQVLQKHRFVEQLELAEKVNKPVIIHCRNAHADMIELLRSRRGLSGIIHSFTGTIDEASHYIELGFCLGFNGIITFTRQYDEVVKRIPLESMVLETDSPYLSPASKRGKRNEPGHILEVAQTVSDLKGMSFDTVVLETTKSARRAFHVY